MRNTDCVILDICSDNLLSWSHIILTLSRSPLSGRHVKSSLLKQFTTKFLQKLNFLWPRYFSLHNLVMPFLKVNIKHRKVERLSSLRMIFSSIFIQFLITSKTEALPDIIKIGKVGIKSRGNLPKSLLCSPSKINFPLLSGGLFDVTDQMLGESGQTRQEIAFRWRPVDYLSWLSVCCRYAVERVNLDRSILPR